PPSKARIKATLFCLFTFKIKARDLPSVSVSPSAEIVEGSSVTLTCSSDANPAAKYTWFKENLLKGQGQSYYFPSIRSEDRGIYYCQAENKHGQITSLQHLLDLPSVSVSPSAEIVEGSSVTLTCSSDANPAANYTWFKEDEDSPTASGQIFNINNTSPEHSGHYICIAQNTRGRHNSTVHLTVLEGNCIVQYSQQTWTKKPLVYSHPMKSLQETTLRMNPRDRLLQERS
uniref:Ig-like domain-containing protein n=1 Tax=Labrus bergylta TaxID=56723 RepID=A0A3Q3EKN8_9LABR